MAIIYVKNKTIKYYDSLHKHFSSNDCVSKLLNYLKEEHIDKKKQFFNEMEWKTQNVHDIPQQQNGYDCGVFSCMYAEFITRNRPIEFSQEKMPYFRMKMIYEICKGLRFNT